MERSGRQGIRSRGREKREEEKRSGKREAESGKRKRREVPAVLKEDWGMKEGIDR